VAFQLRQLDEAQWPRAAVAFGGQRRQAQQAETIGAKFGPRMLRRRRWLFLCALGDFGVGDLRVPGPARRLVQNWSRPSSRGYRRRGA